MVDARQTLIEKLATELAVMGREKLIKALRSLHCPFALDFTDEYLRSVSLERLRHLVFAASLHESGSLSTAG